MKLLSCLDIIRFPKENNLWLKASKFLLLVFVLKVALKMKNMMDCWRGDTDRETSNFLEKPLPQCPLHFRLIFFF